MKPFARVVFVMALVSLVSAQLFGLPSCAMQCIGSALQNTTCAPTDLPCICIDKPFNTQAEKCISTSCTVKEGLTTKNVTTVACGAPVRNRTSTYKRVAIGFYVLSTLSIALRFVARFMSTAPWWWDDGLLVLILFMNTAIFVDGTLLVRNGLGQDIWKVTYDSITNILMYFWINEPIYFFEIACLKVAFLLFYLRIFPNKRIRVILWSLIGINFAVAITFLFASCFMCRPLSYVWTQWDGEHKGHCVDVNTLAFANAGISIVLDFVTLVLPITQIWKLQLSTKKKIGVSMMLSVGIFVTIVSILRLRALVNFSNTANPTWDLWDAGLWSTIELHVGTMCVCMPNFRILLNRIIPGFGPSTVGSLANDTSRMRGNEDSFSNNPERTSHLDQISYSKNYQVEFSRRSSTRDGSSFVQLVDIKGGGGEGPCQN